MEIDSPVDSIREAVFTVSPKRQYRGIVSPTTPAQHGPALNTNYGKNEIRFFVCGLNGILLILFVKCLLL